MRVAAEEIERGAAYAEERAAAGKGAEAGDAKPGVTNAQIGELLAKSLKPATRLIYAERIRQIQVLGYGPEHDDAHGDAQLIAAARCYWGAMDADTLSGQFWPWDEAYWKPRDRQRNLVRAGALMYAARDVRARAGDIPGADRLTNFVIPEIEHDLAVVLDPTTVRGETPIYQVTAHERVWMDQGFCGRCPAPGEIFGLQVTQRSFEDGVLTVSLALRAIDPEVKFF